MLIFPKAVGVDGSNDGLQVFQCEIELLGIEPFRICGRRQPI